MHPLFCQDLVGTLDKYPPHCYINLPSALLGMDKGPKTQNMCQVPQNSTSAQALDRLSENLLCLGPLVRAVNPVREPSCVCRSTLNQCSISAAGLDFQTAKLGTDASRSGWFRVSQPCYLRTGCLGFDQGCFGREADAGFAPEQTAL